MNNLAQWLEYLAIAQEVAALISAQYKHFVSRNMSICLGYGCSIYDMYVMIKKYVFIRYLNNKEL
jgi:hypothetical protein